MKPVLTKTSFNPSPGMIDAALTLFFAKAFHQITKEQFDKWELEILSSGTYHYADKYYNDEKLKRFEFPADRIIRNNNGICHIKGLDAYGTPEYTGSDCDRFYTELNHYARTVGYVNGENAECIAHNELIKAENELIIATKPIHHLELDDVTGLDNRNKLVDLMLGLFSALVVNYEKEVKFRQYFNDRIKGGIRVNELLDKDTKEFYGL